MQCSSFGLHDRIGGSVRVWVLELQFGNANSYNLHFLLVSEKHFFFNCESFGSVLEFC